MARCGMADSVIGVNFCDNWEGPHIAGELVDGFDNWTDSVPVDSTEGKASTVILNGSNSLVTCTWTSDGTYAAGSEADSDKQLYRVYLDDTGDLISISITGLTQWLEEEGLGAYTIRVYQSTDAGSAFSPVDIVSGGVVIDTVQESNHWTTDGGIRAYVDTNILAADNITIDPQNRTGNTGDAIRATVAGIKIVGISKLHPLNPTPAAGIEVPITQSVSWEQSPAAANSGITYELFLGSDPNESSPNYYKLNPVKVTTDDPEDFNYTPELLLENSTEYYWQVVAREPNSADPLDLIYYTGPEWTFVTQPPSARVEEHPASITVASGTAEVSFSVGGINIESYQWYKDGEPLADDTTDELYIGQDSATLTVFDIDLADEGVYYCQVDNGRNEPDESNTALLMTKRLAAWWKLDGDLTDSIAELVPGANAHNGIATEALFATDAIDGNSLELTGEVDNMVTIENSVDFFNFYPFGYTVSAWINMPENTEGHWGAYISKQSGDPRKGFIITTNGLGQPVHTLRQTFEIGSNVEGDDNTWHMVTGTFDADNKIGRVYVDGRLTNEITTTVTPDQSPADLIFGAELPDGTVPYMGMLDNVKIWSYALDSYEIAKAYVVFNPDDEICVEYPEFDFTGPEGEKDCRVDIYDFVQIANKWLECNIVPTCVN